MQVIVKSGGDLTFEADELDTALYLKLGAVANLPSEGELTDANSGPLYEDEEVTMLYEYARVREVITDGRWRMSVKIGVGHSPMTFENMEGVIHLLANHYTGPTRRVKIEYESADNGRGYSRNYVFSPRHMYS